jgi:hypothetical protein
MNVNLHIERLVLEGLSLDSRGGALVQEAVQTELARLLAEGEPALRSFASTAMPSVKGAPVNASPAESPPRLGSAIARSIHGALAR